ncbi:hypothetical protein [Lichenibacterium ramalinae]|uniref:hypothetical protein n=1 Tax=Lichenibacterium ramalinae TaxID=2316527 RepID=UPI00100F75BC|nr:hypothetical protein [Lichenibacterium ramalinae]
MLIGSMSEPLEHDRSAAIGMPVSHVWRGHGSALFIELGALAPRTRRDGSRGRSGRASRTPRKLVGSDLGDAAARSPRSGRAGHLGEFTAHENGQDTSWVTVRAIDSSWCEVETDDIGVLDRVRETFVDVRMDP